MILNAPDLFKMDPATGSMFVDTSANALPPYTVSLNPFNSPLPLTVPAAPNSVVIASMIGPNFAGTQAGFVGQVATFSDNVDGFDDANFTLYMSDFGGRQYMNAPVHARTFFGTGANPGWIYEPLVMRPTQNMQMQFSKISGPLTKIRPYIHGAVFIPKAAARYQWILDKWSQAVKRTEQVHPFWLTTDAPVELTANQSIQVDIKIGYTLELYSMMAVSAGDFSFTLTEVKSNKLLMNGVITRDSCLGEATFPTEFVRPYLLPQNARLRLQLTDLSGATNPVFFTIQSRRIVTPLADLKETARMINALYPVIRPTPVKFGRKVT